jgi:hypothetical protein
MFKLSLFRGSLYSSLSIQSEHPLWAVNQFELAGEETHFSNAQSIENKQPLVVFDGSILL